MTTPFRSNGTIDDDAPADGIEWILKSEGHWDAVVADYLDSIS